MIPVLSGFLAFWDALWTRPPNAAPARAEKARVAAKLNEGLGRHPVRLDEREWLVAATLTPAEAPGRARTASPAIGRVRA